MTLVPRLLLFIPRRLLRLTLVTRLTVFARLAIVTLLTVFTLLALLMFTLLLLAPRIHLALRLAQKSGVMLGMLLKILSRHTVIAQLRITRQLVVFLNDLLRRTTHFSFGTGTVEDPVDYIPDRAVAVDVAVLRPRT